MPVKNTDSVTRSRYNPGPDVLSITLPHHEKLELHGRHNGSLRIERTPDGGLEISTRRDIHAWGSTETVRLDADAARVVEGFIEGDVGGDYITPLRPTMIEESIKAERTARGDS